MKSFCGPRYFSTMDESYHRARLACWQPIVRERDEQRSRRRAS